MPRHPRLTGKTLALAFALLTVPGAALAQQCVSCWTEQCPDLKPYMKKCEEAPRKPAAPKPGPLARPEEPDCKGGRVEVGGHCCWPGQDYGAGTGQCLGEPQCPESMVKRGSNCVPGCEEGKTLVAGHCCWPGQDWATRAQQCVGEPRCPVGHVSRQGDCRPAPPARKMVRIEGGTYTMGESRRQVTVASFLVDETEVTVGQYAVCVKGGGCRPPQQAGTNMDHPVTEVSWDEAVAYCEWAKARLPTEEEWEWAARGGPAGTTYPWGEEMPGRQLCWDGEGSDLGKGRRKGTCPVGSYPSGNSPQGAKDLAGNVWEWTSTANDAASRVFRGGSWINDSPSLLSAARRQWYPPADRGSVLGFRCARVQ